MAVAHWGPRQLNFDVTPKLGMYSLGNHSGDS